MNQQHLYLSLLFILFLKLLGIKHNYAANKHDLYQNEKQMKLMEIATSSQKDFYQQVSYNLKRSVHTKETAQKCHILDKEQSEACYTKTTKCITL